MKNLILMSAQPHDRYFLWQIEVQIVNFRKHGVSDKMHVLVWYPKEGYDTAWDALSQKYPEVRFFFYMDQGIQPDLYIPQLRPHILKMHFLQYPQLKNSCIFYHDSDIIFQELPDFDTLMEGEVNYTSDTSSYLDYSYLTSKERQGGIPHEEVVSGLARLTGTPIEAIRHYDKNAGGAQYLLKGLDANFWAEVEEDCLKIRKFLMGDVNKKYFPSEAAGFQSWCADMWAMNFNLWKRERLTQVTPLLDFSWATDHIDTYYKKPIFHNAGASASSKGLFYKGGWIDRSPIGKKIQVSKNFASYMYVQAISEVK